MADPTNITGYVRVPELTAPDWLVALATSKPAAPPWPAMVRAGLAIGAPLAVADAAGRLPVGLFLAMGALSGVTGDRRGPYRVRALQINLGAVAGATGIAIGQAVHGHAWLILTVLVLVAYASALVSAAGTIASTASLQLLIFAVVTSGRGFPPPAWEPPLLFAAGGAWTLGLTLLGLLRDSASPERRAVAAAIVALADLADAVGQPIAEERRRALTDRLNEAYDALLAGRLWTGGRSRTFVRFMGLLNAVTPLVETTVAGLRSRRPMAPDFAPRLRAVAAALLARRPLPELPAVDGPTPAIGADTASLWAYPHPSLRDRALHWAEEVVAGRTARLFGIRLALCIGAAEIVRSQLPGSRSYWIGLTVAIVLKPDFGSVFARAVQRAVGTVLGALLGAALLVGLPHGPPLIAAIAVLGALLPMAIVRNYGLFSVCVTPLVILLIDLLDPNGWALLTARLLDTTIGCGIVLVVGYLLWPETFRVRIGPAFVDAAEALSAYARGALQPGFPGDRGGLRRAAYRGLSDLRAGFQQALAEPPPVSRRAAAWWPAIVALERLTDTVTQAARAIDRGGPGPPAADVDTVAAAIADLGRSVLDRRPPGRDPLPRDAGLDEVIADLRAAREVLAGPV